MSMAGKRALQKCIICYWTVKHDFLQQKWCAKCKKQEIGYCHLQKKFFYVGDWDIK